MIRPPRKWRARYLPALTFCAAAFLLGGCVYLRLLALKHQLGDFNRNFGLQTSDGLRLTCFNPVLLPADLRWLGIVPEKTAKKGRAEQWWVHWVKEPANEPEKSGPEPAAQDLELELDFTDNKFSGFFVAERYFAFIPKSFFVGLLRGLGDASIDKDKRSISAEIMVKPNTVGGRPTVATLTSLLGAPTERRANGGTMLLRYRYLPPTSGTNNGDFDLSFTFDSATGELLRMEGRSPVGQMLLDFKTPAPVP
jgi:hypothetical protein